MLRDIMRGKDPQVAAVLATLTDVQADVLALQGIDYDHEGRTLTALQEALTEAGAHYPYVFSKQPNTGLLTGLDLDGNGRKGEPRDAQGYGRFSGEGGMAVLSKYPIIVDEAQDFTNLLWQDLPSATLPRVAGKPFPSVEVQAMQRLSTTAHWMVPILLPTGRISVMTLHATPPVFDGAEDRNGLRNRDEIRLWQAVMDGQIGTPPKGAFVIAGDLNLDPSDGAGRKATIAGLLNDARLQDVAPTSVGASLAADANHTGNPAFDTVDWPDNAPGNLRVSYVLPSSNLRVIDAGVFWPAPGDPKAKLLGEDGNLASRHRLVWVDLMLQGG